MGGNSVQCAIRQTKRGEYMSFERGVGRTVVYEWDLEEVFLDGDEVAEHHFADRLADLKDVSEWIRKGPNKMEIFLCLKLIRYEGTTVQGIPWKIVGDIPWDYAYLNDDGTLPEYFTAFLGRGGKVPKRMHKEFERNSEWASQYTNKQRCTS